MPRAPATPHNATSLASRWRWRRAASNRHEHRLREQERKPGKVSPSCAGGAAGACGDGVLSLISGWATGRDQLAGVSAAAKPAEEISGPANTIAAAAGAAVARNAAI